MTDRILEKLDVRAFYSQYTQLSEPSQKGECRGLCPLHEEKTASFWVNVNDGSFKCFGCGKGGGPVQFYAAIKNISPFEASAELLRMYGDNGNGRLPARGRKTAPERMPKPAPVAPPVPVTRHNREPAGASPVKERQREERQASPTEIYQALLDCGRPLAAQAVNYFASRGIRLETLDRFRVSFLSDPREVERRLLDAFGQAALVRAGVFQEKEGRAWFAFSRHPILFPILKDNLPVFIQGRLLEKLGDCPKYCNLSGIPVPALFNVDSPSNLAPSTPVFVCEGAPDTIVLEQAGFHAVGVVGSSGFKSEWVQVLKPFRIYLVLDNDNAGRAGVERIVGAMQQEDLPCWVVSLPDGAKDVNDFFLTHEASDFQMLVNRAEARSVDLRPLVERSLERIADRSDKFSYRQLADRVYSWFENHGGVFVIDAGRTPNLLFERQRYEVGNNDEFNALMLAKTDLSPVQFQGKVLWQMLRSCCFLKARRSATLSWIHNDEPSGAIYLNLHDRESRILRLSPRRTELLNNGTNEAGIILRSADKMREIEYHADVNPKESIELLKRLVLDALPCEPENRLFLACWILTAFFLDFTSEKALMKFSGHTGSGKTTVARILSCLLYGADHVESATVPYYYADASQNPFLICDNLETEDMNRDIVQFLLHVATGIAKGKRKAGTDSETVRESAKALVAITAIEPLTKPELINRTYDVEFRSLFKKSGFMQRELVEQLVKARGKILSGLFQLFAWEVLPDLQERRKESLWRIQSRHTGHAKQRVDSFLTLMVAILEPLLKLLEPGRDRTWEIVDWWIEYQGRLAEETERDTNLAVYLLDALGKEMLAKEGNFRAEYYLDFEKTENECGEPLELSFVASSRDLLMAFQILSKNKGFKIPYASAQQLGVRLLNEQSVLEGAGWQCNKDKTVHGLRYYRLTKKMR